MLKIDWLNTFRVLVETGSFAETAHRIHRTQPAVTQQVRLLEKHTGRALFDRRAGVPTPAGRVLYDRAVQMLNEASDIERELADFDDASVPLRIGTNDTNALYLLPAAIRGFRETHPGSALDIDCRPSAEVVDGVMDGRIDIGVISERELPAELNSACIAENRLRLIVPREHRLAQRKRCTLNTLTGERWVQLDPETTTGQLIESFFSEHDFEPSRAMISSSFEVIKRYVSEGVGIAVVPEHAISSGEAPDLAALAVTGLPKLRTLAIWPRDRYQTRAAKAFLDAWHRN